MMQRRRILNVKRQLRTSMESDTSGYSSSSQKTENGLYNHINIRPLPEQQITETDKNVSVFGVYTDNVVCLKDDDDVNEITKEQGNSLHTNGDISLLKPPLKRARKKSVFLEDVFASPSTSTFALKRSRRLSINNEEISKSSNGEVAINLPQQSMIMTRRKSVNLERFDFPKINSSDNKAVQFDSSLLASKLIRNNQKTRRQSCYGLENASTIAESSKKVTRRRSVYVGMSSELSLNDKIKTRRQSQFIEKANQPVIRRSRRKSVCLERYQKYKESQISTKNTAIPHKPLKSQKRQKKVVESNEVKVVQQEEEVVEEVIEDVWFVTLETVVKTSEMRFLVKWEGFPVSENTYEPFENLRHCQVLQEYVDRKFMQLQDQIDGVCMKLLSETQEQYDYFKSRPKASIVRKFCKFDELDFKCSLLAYIFTYGGEVKTCFMNKLRHQNLIYQFYAQWKKEQESNYMLVETIMSEENYSFTLTAENNIDYEPIPKFEYLPKVIYPLTSFGLGMGLNVGCKCGRKCNKKTNCCPQSLGWNFIYNEADEKLSTKDIQMIVECNDFCSCDKDCPNRPKQITAKMVIFKTSERGWGVKTLDHIPSGRFIVEYTGEFLDKIESRRRAKQYNGAAGQYLFDLDWDVKGKVPFSIDATHKGNIARFINHSCNPNLYTWPAITCNQDTKMHKLYYFSQRYIRPGEELTIDYTGGRTNLGKDEQSEKFTCHCNSSNCRGFIF